MNNYSNEDQKQERLTLQDTKKKQELMRNYLIEKIKCPIVTENDKKTLPGILQDALLSQPALSGMKPSIELKGIRIPLAPNVFSLLLKILYAPSYKKDDEKRYVKLILRERTYEIELVSLWKLLFNYCNDLSAGASAEALSRSREKEIRRGIGVRDFVEENEKNDS